MNIIGFILKMRRLPINDDLERINCKQAGEIGHTMCGWCDIHDRPIFECSCKAIRCYGLSRIDVVLRSIEMKDIYLEIESVPSKLVLAEECWQCSGSGKAVEESWANEDGTCNLCDGKGLRITADGKSILALLALGTRAKEIEDHNDWLDQQQTQSDARNAGCP